MKKWNKFCFLLAACLTASVTIFAQTEKFDIVTCTPPKDWKKDSKPGVLNFTNVNTGTGGFCVLTIYASTNSAGNAQTDFNNEWKKLVADPFKADNNPKKESETTGDGWDIVAAAVPVSVDGANIYIFLTVLSGHGKTVSIRTSLNDEAYLKDMAAFLETIELDATKTPVPVNNPVTEPIQATGMGQFGAMRYTPPYGWSHQLFSDGVVFKPLELPAGEHLAIQIMQPLQAGGSLEQALAKSYDEAAGMYNGTKMNYAGTGQSYQKTEAKTSFQGWEYIRCNGGVRIGNGDYPPEYGLDLFVIKVNNRFERIAVLKSRTINRSCSMSAFYADDNAQYKSAIDNFLFQLQFTDGPQPLIAQSRSIKGDGVMGVWQGISMQASASSGLRYSVYTPLFLPNGQAYFGAKFPSEGLYETDTRVPAELYRRDWGFYSYSNGKGVLKMPYGELPLRMEGKTLIITANNTDHKFYQLPSVNGAKFNGTYIMTEAYGKIPSITFSADGKFSDNGAIRVLTHEYNDCINPGLTPGSGSYTVQDYTITFNYNDGRKIKIAFLGTEYDINNQSPAVLRMSNNEDPMTRR